MKKFFIDWIFFTIVFTLFSILFRFLIFYKVDPDLANGLSYTFSLIVTIQLDAYSRIFRKLNKDE